MIKDKWSDEQKETAFNEFKKSHGDVLAKYIQSNPNKKWPVLFDQKNCKFTWINRQARRKMGV